jgi:hypothetical protein
LCFFACLCAISNLPCAAAGATAAAEPSLIALVNVSTPLAATKTNNFKPDIILAAFQLLLVVQGPNKNHPKYSPNGLLL